LLASAALLTSACWGAAQSLSPPDLTDQTSEIDQTIARVDQIRETIKDDLDRFDALRRQFFEAPSNFYASPFPLDLFKHASMSCLNDPPSDQGSPAPPIAAAADQLGIDCAVAPLPPLVEALQAVPARRDTAVAKLQTIDRIRQIKFRLARRLRQLSSVVRRTRNYLATRRAEARQQTREIERRRPEYRRKEYEEARRRLAAYTARLDALDHAIAGLESAGPAWSRSLGTSIEAIYQDLSRLGRP